MNANRISHRAAASSAGFRVTNSRATNATNATHDVTKSPPGGPFWDWAEGWRRLLPAMFLTVLALLPPVGGAADQPWVTRGADGQPEIQLYFFWARTCPHCLEAHPHIEALARDRPWLRLQALEVSRHPDHARRFQALAAELGQTAASVPAFLFCGEMHVGWDRDEGMGARLRQGLEACRTRVLAGLPPAAANPAAPPPPNPAPSGVEKNQQPPPAELPLVELPLMMGAIDPSHLSLPVLTLILAGLDAFNPCAFFVLLFLLSLMVHQHSRGRMLLIGGIFITLSGLMYFAFMAAWLSVFQLLGHLSWVTLGAGVLAVLVGLLNIKDFFLFGRGPSLSIPEAGKPGIFRRARAILTAESLPAMMLATAFLALAANFYELLCTAGFPMVYTRLLTLAELTPVGRLAYLAAYNLIYVTPLALIVILFARTLGARKLTEREGRLLKLLSGLMMLGLGILLVVAPELISQISIALLLLILALGLTALAAWMS